MLGIVFKVPGKPRAKQSFKVGKNGGYAKPETKAWQDTVSIYAKQTMNMNDMFVPFMDKERLRVFLSFELPDKRLVDVDNLSKAVLDGCNGILWGDDRQVFDLHVTKKLACNEPGVTISLFVLDDDD